LKILDTLGCSKVYIGWIKDIFKKKKVLKERSISILDSDFYMYFKKEVQFLSTLLSEEMVTLNIML